MSALSDFLEKELLDHVLGNQSWAAPSTIYIALLTGVADGDISSVTEATGGSYVRVTQTNNATNWPAATGTTATKSNGTAITFPTATGSWGGDVTHFAIYKHVTSVAADQLLFWGALTTARAIATGDTPKFNAGELVITAN